MRNFTTGSRSTASRQRAGAVVTEFERSALKPDDLTLKMRSIYATALYADTGATLDDLREAVRTLEVLAPTTRRVMGGAHPITGEIEDDLQNARAALRAREAPSPPGQA